MEKDPEKVTEQKSRRWPRYNEHDFKVVLATLFVIIFIIIVFIAGLLVGRVQGRFSERRGIASPYPSRMGSRGMMVAPNTNGVKGAITAISGQTVTITEADKSTETVTVTPQTVIRENHADVKVTDLKIGDSVVVIGDPGANGDISATFITVQ